MNKLDIATERTVKKAKRTIKSINFTRILLRSLLIFFFACVSYLCNSYETDVPYSDPIRTFFADIYPIFHFPAVYIFLKLNYYTETTYFGGMGINAYLYSLAIELVYFIMHKLIKPTHSNKYRRLGLKAFITGIVFILASEIIPFKKDILPELNTFYNVEPYSILQKVIMYSGLALVVAGTILIFFNPGKTLKEVSIK